MSHASDLIETDILAYLEQHERKEILRFLTCGSVDDGKSTLIGRLLHDSRMIYEDQLEAIRQDSRTIGTQRGGVDLALLVDGLQAEREQGITIDVAYRYFSTARRKFIIADTPGHEQYTRNMVTGASTCDVAIILIDANNGVLPQTRRHSYIAQLLGIRHLIVAVNKMDDVSYEEPVFDAIRDEYFAFASKLPVDDLDFIPLSALLGDNVVEQSANMPWYQGATLMHLLETIPVAAVRDTERLRMPVQYVNRPDADFRGYCGSIVGGVARPGDAITVLPSGRTSTIDRVVTADGDVEEAFPPMAVTLTLCDAVDVSRGDVVAGDGQLPHTADRLDATVVWMAEEPLALGKPYVIKHGARKVTGQIDAVRYHTDINTLAREPASTLTLNEIGRCAFSLAEPLVFDAYANNRDLGALIIIDRISNATVGAAMIHSPGGSTSGDAWEEVPHGDLHASPSRVTPDELQTRLGQRPVTVLFTGLAKAGKTAIARAVERRLFDQGQLATVFDGQSFRLGLSRDLGFSARDRSENMRRAAEAARLVNEAGLICLTAFVVPQESVRERARGTIGEDRFLEVFVTAPLDVLKERDEDGLYAAAERGEAPNIPGVTAPFEEPGGADLVLHTDQLGLEESAEQVVALLREQGFIF